MYIFLAIYLGVKMFFIIAEADVPPMRASEDAVWGPMPILSLCPTNRDLLYTDYALEAYLPEAAVSVEVSGAWNIAPPAGMMLPQGCSATDLGKCIVWTVVSMAVPGWERAFCYEINMQALTPAFTAWQPKTLSFTAMFHHIVPTMTVRRFRGASSFIIIYNSTLAAVDSTTLMHIDQTSQRAFFEIQKMRVPTGDAVLLSREKKDKITLASRGFEPKPPEGKYKDLTPMYFVLEAAKPTVTVIDTVGILERAMTLFTGIGGFLSVITALFFVCFVHSSEPSTKDLLVLRSQGKALLGDEASSDEEEAGEEDGDVAP